MAQRTAAVEQQGRAARGGIPLMRQLPRSARLYAGLIIAIGLILAAVRLPDSLRFAQPVLFVALLYLAYRTGQLAYRADPADPGSGVEPQQVQQTPDLH